MARLDRYLKRLIVPATTPPSLSSRRASSNRKILRRKTDLTGHDTRHVVEMGWSSKRNGELLNR